MTRSAESRRWSRLEYDRLVAMGILHEDEPVELIAGRILVKGRYPLIERGWTAGEYDRLVEAGLLRSGDHVELVGGTLVCREPQGSRHATAVDLAADALRAAFGDGFVVRTEKPLLLGDDQSEPEPDVAVVPGARRDFRDSHPTRAVLIVEVAESSLDLDRRHKGSLYARAGLSDYWIVNLADRVVEVYRTPLPDHAAVFGWRYSRHEAIDAAGVVTPVAAPASRILVADLLP